MDPTYKAVAEFAQTWGLIYFVAIFLVVLIYALWPSRKKSSTRPRAFRCGRTERWPKNTKKSTS